MNYSGENDLKEGDLNFTLHGSNKHQGSPGADDPHDHHDDKKLTPEADYIAADGYGFDYVMVFKTEHKGVMSEYCRKTIRQIIAAGFEVRVYFSGSEAKDKIFCEMRAPVERIMQFADQVNKKLLLDCFQLEEAAVRGDPEASIAPIVINNDPDISFRTAYEFIYARYDRTPNLQNMYHKNDGMWHPFHSVVRLSIAIDILKAPMCLGGAGLKLDKMQLEKQIVAFFPKHFNANKMRLREKWLVFKQWPWEAPYDYVKDYYGEKVGLYFQFLGHLTGWLMPLAVAGFISALTVYASGNKEHPITLVFAPIVVFWSIVMLEYWKRKEKQVALEWGMINFEEGEQTRPEYEGDFIKSHIDGRTVLYYPSSERRSKIRKATIVVVSMILIVISCIAAVYAFRWYLVYGMSGDWGKTWGGIIASIVNSLQIQILNHFYKTFAVSLTDFENHRTTTEYEDSLILKLFCFTFCNSYGGFIYLAFIGEPVVGVDCEYSCISLLATNLTIVFVIQLVVGNFTEVLVPFVKFRMRVSTEKRGEGQSAVGEVQLTEAEKGLHLENYDPIMGIIMDYAELAQQFGYITLFVVSFPLAPLLALANNYVEFRSDAFKLLTQMRRPVPRGAEDIGSWQRVFKIITWIAVITNSALICFVYEDLVGGYSLATRLWLFILFQWIAFIFMGTIEATVPDVPEDVTIQLQRTAFLSSKIIDKVPDEIGDSIEEVDELALLDIEVSVTPAFSPP